eukprot:641292-Hanusia_phi.AAC.2
MFQRNPIRSDRNRNRTVNGPDRTVSDGSDHCRVVSAERGRCPSFKRRVGLKFRSHMIRKAPPGPQAGLAAGRPAPRDS